MLSRVADSLYWMARYIERAEHTARVMAVKLESMVEQTPEDAAASWGRVVEALQGEQLAHQPQDAFAITKKLAFDRDSDSALICSLSMARDNARQVREALSNEVWESLNRLYLRLSPVTMDSIWVHSPARLFREASRATIAEILINPDSAACHRFDPMGTRAIRNALIARRYLHRVAALGAEARASADRLASAMLAEVLERLGHLAPTEPS